MYGRADRAKTACLVRRMLIWILLGRGRLGCRQARYDGAAWQLFEVDVSARKDKLQRHRCKREPSAPPPIGTNPTHWQNAPTPRLEQCTAEAIRGNAFSLKTSLPSVNLAGLLPECNSRRRTRIAFCIEGFSRASSGRHNTRCVARPRLPSLKAIETAATAETCLHRPVSPHSETDG